jgi:hypothetical protein
VGIPLDAARRLGQSEAGTGALKLRGAFGEERMHEWMLGDASYALPRPRRAGGFWRRQFDDAPTRAQRWFDVTFGVVMPILCFYFDPVVFRGGLLNDNGLYPKVQLYAYTISALEIVALCAWLFAAGRRGLGPAVLTGVLLGGAIFSFVTGVMILPYSIFGLHIARNYGG